MEELWSKYKQAMINGQKPRFHLVDFCYIDVFEKYLPIIGIEGPRTDSVILEHSISLNNEGYIKLKMM
jgi:hypothetical protein